MKVKKYLFVGILDALMFIAVLVAGIWLISLSIEIHWLLAMIISIFCIAILGIIFWFSYKFFMLYRSYKYVEKKYTIEKYDSNIVILDESYLRGKLTEEKYDCINGEENGISYSLFRTKNKGELKPNVLFLTYTSLENIIEKDNSNDSILRSNGIPVEESKTLIIVSIPNSKEGIKQIIHLNNPRNVMRKKYYCSFSRDSKTLSFGAYSELLSFEGYNQMRNFVFDIFDLRENSDV